MLSDHFSASCDCYTPNGIVFKVYYNDEDQGLKNMVSDSPEMRSTQWSFMLTDSNSFVQEVKLQGKNYTV
jgi:hypothetical protein